MSGFIVLNWRLDAAGRGLTDIRPEDLAKCSKATEHANLSGNKLRCLSALAGFDNLQTLICDHNYISSLSSLPLLKKLDTLSLNFNHISELGPAVSAIGRSCPALLNLSLMGNPASPSLSSSLSEEDFQDYCEVVASEIPTLRVLDGMRVITEVRKVRIGDENRRASSFVECEIAEWHEH